MFRGLEMIKLKEVPVLRVWMLKKQSEGGRIQQRFTREVIHIWTLGSMAPDSAMQTPDQEGYKRRAQMERGH